MKKIILIFYLLFSSCFCFSQSYQYYQWHGFDPGIFCDDTNYLTCQVLNFEVDTQRNVLWIFGNFEGAGTVNSKFIVGYQNNQFITFPDTFQAYGHSNDYLFYQGNLVGCLEGGVWSYNIDSQQFTSLGTFPSSTYLGGLCLAEYKGDLYVGGHFGSIKGPTGGWVGANGIAKWNGTTWNALGSGLTGSGVFINDLVVYDNKLTVGGSLLTAGGIPAWNIAQWNDTTWNNMSTGTGSYGTNNIWNQPVSAEIKDMEVFENNLYIIGDIDSVCGIPAHLAYWNGTNWTGTSYPIHALFFKSFLNHLILFSAENNVQIDWWENNQMIPVDSMFDQTYIGAMETFNDTLFVSGGFLSSGNTPLFRLARLIIDTTLETGTHVISDNNTSVIIYPSPAQSEITIETSGEKPFKQISITDVLGREVKSFKYKVQSHSATINISEFSAGVYFIKAQMQDGSVVIKKFVKQ